MTATVPADFHRLVGQVIAGRLRVLDVVHTGPRGVIYEAEPPGVGKIRRALKLLTLPEALEPVGLRRLRALLDLKRGLQHPHLETTYEVGVLGDQTPYVLTEWHPSPPLSAVLEQRNWLPMNLTLQIVSAIADALDALHSRGLVHGDLRPGHVLCDLGEAAADCVVVSDAVVAAALNAPPSGGATGAIGYLAPERARGRPPSPVADIYALGVLTYRMLSGVLPYRPNDVQAVTAGPDPIRRVRWLHVHGDPPPPPLSRPKSSLDRAVNDLVRWAMARSPSRRIPDGGAFRYMLNALIDAPESWRLQTASQLELIDSEPTDSSAQGTTAAEDRWASDPWMDAGQLEAETDADADLGWPPSQPPLASDDTTLAVSERGLSSSTRETTGTERITARMARQPLWVWSGAGLLVGGLLALLT